MIEDQPIRKGNQISIISAINDKQQLEPCQFSFPGWQRVIHDVLKLTITARWLFIHKS
jgi:hypothetical protein